MDVVLCLQIILQILHGREEPGAVGIVEGLVHGIAQGEVLLTGGIVGICCDAEGGTEQEGQ